MNQSEPHICDMYILHCRNVDRITGDITHHVCGIINDNTTKKSIVAKICINCGHLVCALRLPEKHYYHLI